MSAPQLKLSHHAGEWISLAEASRRSGLTVSRIRGYCPEKYEPRGLARKVEISPGTFAWEVNEAADDRFLLLRSADRVPDSTDAPGSVASEKQIEIAHARERILIELEQRLEENDRRRPRLPVNAVFSLFARHLAERGAWGATQGTSAPSVRTLRYWRSTWLESGRELAALYPRGKDSDQDPKSPNTAYFELLQLMFLSESNPQKAPVIRAANVIARRDGIAIPHPKAAQRFLRDLELKQPGKVVRYRGGDTAFENRVEPYISRDRSKHATKQADGSVVVKDLRSDQIWCADHHVCDVIVRHRGRLIRPWLTAVLDIRSNRIVGRAWSAGDPDSHSVLLAFRDAILRGGKVIPDEWFVDNGKDFDAWMFMGQTKIERRTVRWEPDRPLMGGIMSALGVKTRHARPYNARSKPVERFFGIFEENFGKFCWTYCGRTPQHKPECLADRLEDLDQVPTFEEFTAEADAWIYRVHHAEPLTCDLDKGLSRDQVWQDNRTSIRRVSDESIELLLMPVRKRKVTRNGVEYAGVHYHDPALVSYFGQEVALRVDPANIATIGVWEIGFGRKIAEVAAMDLAAYGDVSETQMKKVNDRVNAIRKAAKAVTDLGGHAYVRADRKEMLDRVRREQAADAPEPAGPTQMPSVRITRTPIDDASMPDRPQPRPRRLAAGGELIDLTKLGEEGF